RVGRRRSLRGGRVPSAAERLVDLDDRDEPVTSSACELDLTREDHALRFQNVEVVGEAVQVALLRDLHGVASRVELALEHGQRAADLLIRNEGVVDLAEGELHGSGIADQRLLMARARLAELALQASPGEERQGHRWSRLPEARRADEQIRQREALHAQG